MFKTIESILFATNLSENCKTAFDFAGSLAARYQATIVLLHVIEKIPDYMSGRLIGLLGKQQWEAMTQNQEKDVQEALSQKRSSRKLIRTALNHFCTDAGIDDDSCGYHSREIVVSDGEVVDEIIARSIAYKCDLIIMGAREGFLVKTSIGSTIKSVLRQSKIPVLVVPPAAEKP